MKLAARMIIIATCYRRILLEKCCLSFQKSFWTFQQMSLTSIFVVSLISCLDALCSWNRHEQPDGDDNAATMNFLNGKWTADSSQNPTGIYNGQRYWRKTQYDGCYVPTLWLYRDTNGIWLITATFGSSAASAYAYCNKSPSPSDPTDCDGHWAFAPHGVPTSQEGLYQIDSDFTFSTGDCPQVLCESVEFVTNANDFFAGIFTRFGLDDQSNMNVYTQNSTLSSSGIFYLYFNREVFKWIVNEEYDMNCGNAINGGLTAVSGVYSWSESSASSGGLWFFVEDGSTATKYITCDGMCSIFLIVSWFRSDL